MKILHIVPGLNDPTNGIAVAAKMIANRQNADIIDVRDLQSSNLTIGQYSEVWVHSMWLPQTMRACWKVMRGRGRAGARPSLVRMTHANLDPVRLAYHGWKKRLVGPIERWLFSKTDRVVVTCAAEKAWCERWGLKNEFEVVDLKRFFGLERKSLRDTQDLSFSDLATTPTSSATPESQNAKVSPRGLHVLYLGRRHPLKGVRFLERAMRELNGEAESFPLQKRDEPSLLRSGRDSASPLVQLRIVSDHFGEELEKDWAWCDVLCLPTLSENFGLVVAEALERGKRVIVTDGAPAWEPPSEAAEVEKRGGQWWSRLFYLRGYRDGTDEERVKMLKGALERR